VRSELWRLGTRRSVTAALVLALHAGLIAVLLALHPPPSRRPVRRVSVQLDLSSRSAAPPRRRRTVHPAGTALALRHPGPTSVVTRPGVVAAPAPLPAQERLTCAVRWFSALRRAARTLGARRASPEVIIGFPRADPFPRAPQRRSWDGWDPAATHRIRMLRSGGTAVLLNDHCAIDFEPFPILGCALGKASAPGNLFAHMRHRSADELP
jgi:hypothetical protein